MSVAAWVTVKNDGSTPVWMIVVASVVAAVACFGFIWLLIKDPDRLQTEHYRIQTRALELVEDKTDTLPVESIKIDTLVSGYDRTDT